MGRIADLLVGREATLGGASAAGPVLVGLEFTEVWSSLFLRGCLWKQMIVTIFPRYYQD